MNHRNVAGSNHVDVMTKPSVGVLDQRIVALAILGNNTAHGNLHRGPFGRFEVFHKVLQFQAYHPISYTDVDPSNQKVSEAPTRRVEDEGVSSLILYLIFYSPVGSWPRAPKIAVPCPV